MSDLVELIHHANLVTERCRLELRHLPQARRYERAQRMLAGAILEVRKAEVLTPLRVVNQMGRMAAC